MTYDEAVRLLLVHGIGYFDEEGEPVALKDGFLGMLRPYQGLIESNFHLVMESLFVAGECFHASHEINRQLAASLWGTSVTMRRWGLDPRGMLQRNHLITPSDTKRLAAWVGVFEKTSLALMRGCPPWLAVEYYAQHLIDFGPGENIAFFVPLMRQNLEDEDSTDPGVVIEALGKLGSTACEAVPSLEAAAGRTYPDYCHAETQKLIAEAIRQINSANLS